MNKVAVYTIQSMNYGNRLQNYAVQTILRKLGYKAETLQVYGRYDNKECLSGKSLLKRTMLRMLLFYSSTRKAIRLSFKNSMESRFCEFNTLIDYSQDYISAYSYRISDQYDAIIAGSDQIWNPAFRDRDGGADKFLDLFLQASPRLCLYSIGLI